jgi:hypothetical protein
VLGRRSYLGAIDSILHVPICLFVYMRNRSEAGNGHSNFDLGANKVENRVL